MSGDVMGVKEISSRYRRGVLGPELPAGYKKTDIGVIPEDWIPLSIKDFSSVKTGPFGTLLKASEYSEGDGVPLISVGEIGIGKFRISEHTPLVSKIVTNRLPQYLLKKGDIVFGRKGAVDRSALVTDREAGWFLGSDGISIRPDQRNEPAYLAYQFQRHDVQQWLLQNAAGTTMASLNQAVLGRVRIPCPPKHEQRAIATALSDVDALLEVLDRLIAKKRDLKQATMQKLLTGQTRLPGFEGEWLQVRFGEVALPSSTRIDPSRSAQSEFCVELEHIEQRTGRLVGFTSTSQQSSLKAVFESGDVLFGKLRAYLRKYWLADREGTCSTEVWVLRPNPEKAISGYLYQLVRTDWFIEAASTAYGTHMPRSDWKVVRELELSIPELAEQEAISQTLGDMDAEVEALEQRRTKITTLKQAMMQELLTGRTRLVEDNSQDKPDRDDKVDRPSANVYFMRSVLAAEIVDLLHQEPTFGHVKFQKILFLVEHLCDVDTGANYRRQAAGPYDNRTLRSIDSQLRKQRWFDARKEGGRYHYVSLDKTGGHKAYFERYYAGIKARFFEVIETFRNLDTERCEIVATLFSAWDDLLKEKDAVSDAMIVHEVLNHWHESKRRIPEDRWLSALGWMREKGFVPKGAV